MEGTRTLQEKLDVLHTLNSTLHNLSYTTTDTGTLETKISGKISALVDTLDEKIK